MEVDELTMISIGNRPAALKYTIYLDNDKSVRRKEGNNADFLSGRKTSCHFVTWENAIVDWSLAVSIHLRMGSEGNVYSVYQLAPENLIFSFGFAGFLFFCSVIV